MSNASELYNAAQDDSTAPFAWMIEGLEDDWTVTSDIDKRGHVIWQLELVAEINSIEFEENESEIQLIIDALNSY